MMPDEVEGVPALTEGLLGEGALAPSLWALKVANCLLVAERRGRIGPGFRQAALADLALLPIALDAEAARLAWGRTSELAAVHRLTLYDAAYLELALRHCLPLATLDADLIQAAKAVGVPIVQVRP